MFVVAPGLGLARFETHDRIGVALLKTTQWNAHQRGLCAVGKTLLQTGPVVGWQLFGQQGDGGFGGDHQIGGAAGKLAGVPVQRQGHA